MSERKYRQRGYQDTDRERERPRQGPQERPPGPPKGAQRDGPRRMQMPGFQEVLRCSLCGALIPPPLEISAESQCPKCRADLHTCKNCRYFDTGAQFECTQPIPARITKKDIRNNCQYFMARTSIERETRDSGGSSSTGVNRSVDPRSAFDNLFKK
jgi:hypothetical protein